MTAEEMAAIHYRSIVTPLPWNVPTFEGFLRFPGAISASESAGFVLGRVVADEAEILTLAVLPEARRQGIGARCLAAFEDQAARRHARRIFLEVAASNDAARALYEKTGYVENGRRPAYYKAPDGTRIDAILMEKSIQSA